MENKSLMVALCYFLGILGGLIFLLIDPYKNDPEMRFHAWQSILFVGAWIVVNIGLNLFSSLVFSLWFLSLPLALGFFVLWIVLVVKAYQGSPMRLPVLSEFADKFSKKTV